MYKLLIIMLLAFLFGQVSAEPNQMIILLTNPRTVSTAFEKSILARGDFEILHEPWNSSFLYHHASSDIFSQLPPQEFIEAENYDQVKALVYRHAEQNPIFLKEMIWSCGDEMANDHELLSDSSLVLAFLIRDPSLSLESYFLKGSEVMPVDRVLELCQTVYRYDYLVRIAEKYYEIHGKWPLIVEAEELGKNPESTMQAFCSQAGISYVEKALTWEAGIPDDWNHFQTWHTDAAESRNFYISKHSEATQRFSLIPEQYLPIMEEAYQKQLPFYNQLRAMKR